MAKATIHGATIQCTCGDAPQKLIVERRLNVRIEKQWAATVIDHAPMVNIPSFGTCKTLTAAASGTPTPCVPATTEPWTPGSSSVVNVGKQPVLLDSDTLFCTVGGTITIAEPGTQKTNDT